MSVKVSIENVSVTLGGKTILSQINLNLQKDEHWAIIGPSGAGKTTLAKAICNSIFFRGKIEISTLTNPEIKPNVILIEQQHRFKNKSNVENFYYQQRYNSTDKEDASTVEEELNTSSYNTAEKEKWIAFFSIQHILNKPLIQLSNGENKRLQLAKAMLKKPDLLILDNPFIGLDTLGRSSLKLGLNEITAQGISIILIAAEHDFPSCITNVAFLENGKIAIREFKQEFLSHEDKGSMKLIDHMLLKKCFTAQKINYNLAIKMVNVNIQYNQHKILSNINWEVKAGEKWCLTGPNGSGKSTLLSLITADNPQAYANEIYLFDRKRGSGESIWDIKKNIGYLSPELHLYFQQNETCFQTIASGFFDTIGLFRKPNIAQTELVLNWMKILHIAHVAEKYMNQLSLGEQRLVLLARALVKNPPLLILDEPCQGLDAQQTTFVKEIIDRFCSSNNRTLIYVSHYQADIPSSINNYIELENGSII
jgi:molybdate transport system ATP-binding protein